MLGKEVMHFRGFRAVAAETTGTWQRTSKLNTPGLHRSGRQAYKHLGAWPAIVMRESKQDAENSTKVAERRAGRWPHLRFV